MCDNIENFKIILSSERILNINDQENSDLWITFKSEFNNFDIVIRFDIQTFSQEEFYDDIIMILITIMFSQLIDFVNLLANFNLNAIIIMSISWNQIK